MAQSLPAVDSLSAEQKAKLLFELVKQALETWSEATGTVCQVPSVQLPLVPVDPKP